MSKRDICERCMAQKKLLVEKGIPKSLTVCVLVYILAFVLCTVSLVVFRIIVRTDGQSCQALIRACA